MGVGEWWVKAKVCRKMRGVEWWGCEGATGSGWGGRVEYVGYSGVIVRKMGGITGGSGCSMYSM